LPEANFVGSGAVSIVSSMVVAASRLLAPSPVSDATAGMSDCYDLQRQVGFLAKHNYVREALNSNVMEIAKCLGERNAAINDLIDRNNHRMAKERGGSV
jgi:hypothetical protein